MNEVKLQPIKKLANLKINQPKQFYSLYVELVIISIVWIVAYYFRFEYFEGYAIKPESFFVLIVTHLFIYSICFFKYKTQFNFNLLDLMAIVSDLLKRAGFSFFYLIIGLYFFSDQKISRIVLVTVFVLQILATTIYYLLKSNRFVYRKNILVILNPTEGHSFFKEHQKLLNKNNIIGWLGLDKAPNSTNQIYKEMSLNEIQKNILEASYDTLIFTSDYYNQVKVGIESSVQDFIGQVYILPDANFRLLGASVNYIKSTPLFVINSLDHLNDGFLFIKRVIDFFGSLFGLIILSPLLIFLAVLVKLTSSGPVFFKQKRVGLNGIEFYMYKFRSMRTDLAPQGNEGWTTENDPRKTKFGHFIRRTSLDELPQLINVLIGNMSLVGPRPEQPFYVEQFRSEIPAYMLRHKMKSGITGWAQVNGLRGDTSISTRVEYDLFYIRNWSVFFDFKILFLTFLKGFINKNAY